MSPESFSGFAPHDFDAYAPNKWRSNVFNLERMQVKDKLLRLADALSPLYPSPDAAPLAQEASVEHPALWNQNQVRFQAVYFLRPEEERRELFSRITRARPMASLVADPSPFREHIHLAIQVDQEGLELALRMFPEAAVDRENAERKLADAWQMQVLGDRLAALDAAFDVQLHPAVPGPTEATPRVDAAAVRAALGAGKPPTASGLSLSAKPSEPLLHIGARLPRSDERLGTPEVVPVLKAHLDQLLPLYAFFAWSRSNDFLAVKEAIRQEKKAKRQRGLAPDDSVRVVRGLFSGKNGVVTEIDARGGVRVRIGTMVVKLAAEDVTPVG